MSYRFSSLPSKSSQSSDDGSRFFLMGIAPRNLAPSNLFNQPSTFVDELADSAGCTCDLP
ncbi:hypothetical protein B0H19DRAFT_1368987 [Mycena capillaripes]|nr:hypothetical protein B0H19DRAFT_1368987 [Mycena capillaripes]